MLQLNRLQKWIIECNANLDCTLFHSGVQLNKSAHIETLVPVMTLRRILNVLLLATAFLLVFIHNPALVGEKYARLLYIVCLVGLKERKNGAESR